MTDNGSLQQDHTVDGQDSPDETAEVMEPSKRTIRFREAIATALSLAGGIAILLGTQNVLDRDSAELGARFWPTLLGWGIICLAVLLVTTNVVPAKTSKDFPDPMTGWGLGRLVITFVVLVAYLMLFNVITLWVITFVTIALLLLLYGFRSWKLLLLFPGIIAAVLHVLFVVLLRVPLG